MQALPREYELSVCEIKTLDNELLVAGFVNKITDEYLQIGSYKGERLPLLQFDLPVKISVHNAKNGFRVVAGTVYISTDDILRIVGVESLQDFERRAFFRVAVHLPAMLVPLPSEVATLPKIEDDEPEQIPVLLGNLSLSGLLFEPTDPDRSFLMGDRYMVEMQIPVGKLSFNIRICRYEQYPDKPKRYGCEFFGYTQKQADRLCSYIFEIERDIIRKKKNVI